MQGNQIKLPTTDHYLGINDCFTIDWKWYIKKLCTEALQIGATLLLLFSKRNFRRTVDYMQYTDMLKVTKKKLTQDQSRRAHQHDLKQPSLNENSSCWTKKKNLLCCCRTGFQKRYRKQAATWLPQISKSHRDKAKELEFRAQPHNIISKLSQQITPLKVDKISRK